MTAEPHRAEAKAHMIPGVGGPITADVPDRAALPEPIRERRPTNCPVISHEGDLVTTSLSQPRCQSHGGWPSGTVLREPATNAAAGDGARGATGAPGHHVATSRQAGPGRSTTQTNGRLIIWSEGALADVSSCVHDAMSEALQAIGCPAPSRTDVGHVVGLPLEHALMALSGRTQVAGLVAPYQDAYAAAAAGGLRPIPGNWFANAG